MGLREEYAAANRRGREQRAATSPAVSAHYDVKSGRIWVKLTSGVDLMFSPASAEGLEGATAAQLRSIEITPSGLGLYFPKLDADVYIPGLLEGALGSRKWMASRLGAEGGRKTSTAKKRAARSNGKLGGRPRKAAG